MIWKLMLIFVIRLATGLSFSMLLIPSRLVISGFFRVHLWVTLGLFTFAALIAGSFAGRAGLVPTIVGATLSYVGAVIWLYEKPRWGWWSLLAVTLSGIWALWQLTPGSWWTMGTGMLDAGAMAGSGERVLAWPMVVRWLEHGTSSALLGLVFCAMLLGHWYLNTPTMQILPLQRLTWLIFVAVLLRAAVATLSVWLRGEFPIDSLAWALLGLQWLAGLLGLALVTVMTWQTLKIPNTQSATGILYVGVILAFLGEMAALIPLS